MDVEAIELLPALSGETIFDPGCVAQTLLYPVQKSRSGDFTGRPATEVFACRERVVKIRSDFVFQPKDVLRRAQAARRSEVELQVHHPHKTWFFASRQGQKIIGSVTPRLTPLNTLLVRDDANQNDSAFWGWIDQFFLLYFKTAALHNKRLDEGLSNFALDDQCTLYYVDDDIYPWDDFTSLAHMVAVWIRQHPWLDTVNCALLSDALVEQVSKIIPSPHALHVVHGQFRAVESCSARERECMAVIIDGLSAAIKKRSKGVAPVDVVSSRSQQADDSLSFSSKVVDDNSTKPVAVLADVHANLPALSAVLEDIQKRGIDSLLILGDLVGYGPHPNECVERLSELSLACFIQGNHDYAAASGDIQRGFSKMARWAIEWTRDLLTADSQAFLLGLPPVVQQEDWMAVHGAPIDKHYFYAYVYQMTYQANLDWLEDKKIVTAWHGHSHMQTVYGRSRSGDQCISMDKTEAQGRRTIRLQEFTASLVCPGSVGQPRGGDWRAEYAIWFPKNKTVEYQKCEYDLGKTLSDMQRFTFPDALISRYQEGK